MNFSRDPLIFEESPSSRATRSTNESTNLRARIYTGVNADNQVYTVCKSGECFVCKLNCDISNVLLLIHVFVT